MNICPICQAFITDMSVRQVCQRCGNGNRTRTLAVLYRKMRAFTKEREALLFSAENWIEDEAFAVCERSIYGGKNHLDIQAIDRPDDTYDWITANHVLEHVEHDVAALGEMMRIAKPSGIVQITVPTPNAAADTNDWGFPDPTRDGHYRNYGSDFLARLEGIEPRFAILCAFAADPCSPFNDVVYFLSKSDKPLAALSRALFAKGTVTLPVARAAIGGEAAAAAA